MLTMARALAVALFAAACVVRAYNDGRDEGYERGVSDTYGAAASLLSADCKGKRS